MSTVLDDPAVRAYLDELRAGLADSPERELVLEGVTRHIEDALGGGPADPGTVQRVLEELGDPAVIVAEAAPAVGAADAPPAAAAVAVPFLDRRAGAVLTVLLLVLGGLAVPVLGWIAGVVLLWASHGWRTADKVIGTVAAPVLTLVGVALIVALHATAGVAASGSTGGGGTSLGPLFPEVYDVLWAALIATPLVQAAVGVYLLVRFRPLG